MELFDIDAHLHSRTLTHMHTRLQFYNNKWQWLSHNSIENLFNHFEILCDL